MIKDIPNYEYYVDDKYTRHNLDIKRNVYTPSDKQKMFRAKLFQLRNIFKDIDENKLKIADDVIVSVARMTVELRNLEEVLRINGHVEEYKNGAHQSGYKKSAASDAYCSIQKSCLANINFLINLTSVTDNDGKKLTPKDLLTEFTNLKNEK